MKSIKLDLTKDQLDKLAPAFEELHAVSFEGKAGAIVAQIYPDGALVITLNGVAAEALAEIFGKNPERKCAATIQERLQHA